jgi:hypothetical protein
VKDNFGVDKQTYKYRRDKCGVLRQVLPDFTSGGRAAILDNLERAVVSGAATGYPFTLTGPNGLYEQRHRLPADLHRISRKGFEVFGQELLNAGRLVKTTAKGGGKSRSWLDAPTGELVGGFTRIMDGSGVPSA